MKKRYLVSFLIALVLLVLILSVFMRREVPNASNDQSLSWNNDLEQETKNTETIQEMTENSEVISEIIENSDESYAVNLQVDGGYLQLHIPIGYKLQEYELSDIEEYPFSYVFIDEGANSQFIVYSTLDNEKDQGILLRKLYDKSNKNIIFEDVVIGAHTYIVHTKEQASFDYGFLIREGNGYSYHFEYILPYDTIQNEIPAEAIAILSTLSIQESSENTN